MQEHHIATVGEGFQIDRFSEFSRVREATARIKESLSRILLQGVEGKGVPGLGVNSLIQAFVFSSTFEEYKATTIKELTSNNPALRI